ncbi:hypothetical protein BDA96_02G086900 [Sorghum bicolor]|uniref:F-box domain-containing protein n=1 Tax=Sorghum bicolor TaxID=4558 RepID=A0A921RNH6_SORBI|nr:F-box/LRR-repeat protein 25-like isoform X2 [Sorghum bicolor]KAG0542250.1 hypothetical protein BDA96_02G086900 [Sorghum bicolor]|eukprot:XP_021310175.1 F-box/LRR-repeat protein 25-like isoform X2 [Sorghum bicolor]
MQCEAENNHVLVVVRAQMMHPEPTMKRAGGPTNAVDRLSALPDELLHVILSFLPAPLVVQTSLLSRRWRRLWRSTPLIKIHEQEFVISSKIRTNTLEERWAKFEDFATNLLLFHDNTSALGEFRLCCRVHNWRHVDRWIRRGIEYCPSVLQIRLVGYVLGFKLPPMVESNFCCLKRLHLEHIILNSHFTGSLCSACPVLEDMNLDCCEFCDNCPQGIISPKLNKLVMDLCLNNTLYPLVITAPSLTYLYISFQYFRVGILLCKMDSLVKAEISVSETEISEETQRNLLGSLCNVTSLELTGFEAEVMLNDNSKEFPVFHNLQTLVLRSCFLNEYELTDKLEALGSFLQNAPCLEKFSLQYCMFYSFSDSDWEIERKNITLPRHDGKILHCQKLKLIEVIYDHDHDHQLIELVWSLGRRLPDANIKLNKIDSVP